MLSVIIPAKNEIYLKNTIDDILSNAEGEIEIIAELDGYIPSPQIDTKDPRVVFYHQKEGIGQRACVNHGVSVAKGEFIMKCDAHCAFDKGFDVKLAEDCESSWTVIPRMYNLDVTTWKPKLHKLTDYMYITSPTSEKPFRADYYTGEEYRRQHNNPRLIDDTMACMGPCWFMRKDRFWEQGGCDEKHGSWGAMSIEVSLKAWLSGGSLKVNKNTWFAHYFRGGVGFPYQISGNDVDKARKYSQDLWLNDKWSKATRKLEWVVDKFQPPTWGKEMEGIVDNETEHIRRWMYDYVFSRRSPDRCPRWRGVKVVKYPNDLLLYEQVLWEYKPDILIECGAGYGGSALFFGDIFNIIGKGQVISIDRKDTTKFQQHPRVTFITGHTTDALILEKVRELTKDKTVMVVLDSDHRRKHVKRELYYYGPMVTKGQFIVVEDIYNRKANIQGPGEAVNWYLKRKTFKRVDIETKFLLAITRDGWLQKQ